MCKKFLTGLVLFVFLFAGTPASVRSSQNTQFLDPQVQRLDNGLTLITTPMPGSGMVSVYALIKVGSALEGEYAGGGLTHFMEHMLFKGTERRAVGDIPKEVQSLGGTINASTSFDRTIYTLTVPREHFEQAVDILSDMLMNPRFDQEDIDQERDVVFNEMRMHDANPKRYLTKRVQQTAYREHPYRFPIIGYPDLLGALQREDFLRFYRRHYVPNNMIMAVAGGVEAERVRDIIGQAFSEYPRETYPLRNLPDEPRQTGKRVYQEAYPDTRQHLSLVYQGIPLAHDDLYALDALASVLGGSRSSRLNQELVEKQRLVQSVTAANFTPVDRGLFEIELTFESDVSAEDVVAAVQKEIERVKKKGVRPEELKVIQKKARKHFVYSQETSASMAYQTSTDLALTGNVNFSRDYAQAFQEVTPKDVQDAAETYLNNARLSSVHLYPRSDKPEKGAPGEEADAKAAEITRHTLDNGITILLRRDPTLPMVVLDLVLNGGVRAEPEGLNGIANMTAGLWAKAVGRYDSEAFSRLLDRQGISLSGFSGRNSMGVRVSSLLEDFPLALELFALTVKQPRFDKDDITTRRKQILSAIEAREDDPTGKAQKKGLELLFRTHPLGRTELGEEEAVRAITREAIVDFYQGLTVGPNMTIAVFGDIDPDEVLADLEKMFGALPEKDADAVDVAEPGEIETHSADLTVTKDQAVVSVAYRGVDMYHPDRYGLEVLSAVLGSPFRGRMFSVIREEMGMAYSLGGGCVPSRDSGFCRFRVLTAPETVEEVSEAFTQLVEQLKSAPLEKGLLEDIKAYLIGNHRRGLETNQSFAFSAALNEAYGLGYDHYREYEKKIRAVSAEDVRALARKYFIPENEVRVTVVPE
ncbi:MAG: M16 family metallopeptidase [Candidatus Omnitrophota bacterium]